MTNTITYNGMTFTDASIMSAQISVDTALNQRTLDVDTMTAVIESSTDLTSFQQDTPVRFLRGGSQYSLWYINQITRIAPSRYSLNMMSSLGRLTQMEHRGGIYDGVDASTVIADICGTIPYFIQDVFKNVLLYGWLPYVSPSSEHGAQTGSAKDNLLKVLFALNATVRDDAEGTLRIENLSTAVSSQIGPDRIYSDNANVVYEPTVTAVTVLEHQFISGGELTTLFEGTTVAGQVIVFREPMGDLSATGFSITESGANYAVVSAGSGTLTGRKYIHTTREITKSVATAAIPNVARIEDATLVGVTNSTDVVNRLVEYYKHRTYINVDATIDFEDAGDVIELYDPFDKVMRQACIEKISPLVVSNTMKGSISALVGFTPWQVVPFEDVRELLTGSGTWTVPEGVTEVTAVLIGGGQGAYAGKQGGSSPAQQVTSTTTSYTDSTVTQRGSTIASNVGGEGGTPGQPGSGGEILRVTLSVEPGQSISFSCGEGGAGAPSGSSNAGSRGTSTTFGDQSSADGDSSETGYTDPTTGEHFGQVGETGISGGKGASYNEPTTTLTYEGRSWTSGSQGSTVELPSSGNYKSGYGAFGGTILGSYGGGPAYGANGSGGTRGSGSTTSSSARGYPAIGGTGAAAQPFPKATEYGRGGRGGNGGGGGGAGGLGNIYNSYSPSSASSGASYLYWTAANPSTGGAGSAGGDGADGCIILYYRGPVTE